MLASKFGAKAVRARKLAQFMGSEFAGKKFDLIIANYVFEPGAIRYRDKRAEGLSNDRALVNALRHNEREMILRLFARHLAPGGKIILTGISGEIVFRPSEARNAGLSLELGNATDEFGNWATVYSMPAKNG